jgi:hypothetical protein
MVDDEYLKAASASVRWRAKPFACLPTMDKKNFPVVVFPVSFSPTANGVGHYPKTFWRHS